jgi:hypothetical protein
MPPKYAAFAFVLLSWVVAWAPDLEASQRRFTFVYESTTSSKGEVELENWATWKNGRESGNQVEFRHEIEYGVTDRFQASLYVANWEVNDSKAGGDEGAHAAFQDSAVELIYGLSNPVKDILGSALYGEFKAGPKHFELEGKLILQKNFGPIVVAYNAILESEWEGEEDGLYNEQKGAFEQSFGVSYQFNPYFLVGGELLHEIEFPEWSDANDSIVYIGPNASLRYKRFWLTTTILLQVMGISDEPDLQLRTIFGVEL